MATLERIHGVSFHLSEIFGEGPYPEELVTQALEIVGEGLANRDCLPVAMGVDMGAICHICFSSEGKSGQALTYLSKLIDALKEARLLIAEWGNAVDLG
jgi:hypothetical protein